MSGRAAASHPCRDLDEILAGLLSWLRARDPTRTPELVGVERPPAGFSSETLLVDVRPTGAEPGRVERLVLKLPPAGPGIFPAYDFVGQARVQEAVAAAGIPAPAPVQVEADTRWLGAPFLVMPAISGHVVDQVPAGDRWLTGADPSHNAIVHNRYIDVVADINRVDWRACGLAGVVPRRDNAAEIEHWREYLAWYADGAVIVPTLVEALDWCEANLPASEPEPSLLWGDVRLGNVIFDEERTPVAVIDWEMATVGAAEHDLAWALALEGVQAELLRVTVPGFLDHHAAVSRYEARLGRRVQALAWYEILALIRSTAIMTRIAYLHHVHGRPAVFPIAANPILEILERRIAAAGSDEWAGTA